MTDTSYRSLDALAAYLVYSPSPRIYITTLKAAQLPWLNHGGNSYLLCCEQKPTKELQQAAGRQTHKRKSTGARHLTGPMTRRVRQQLNLPAEPDQHLTKPVST